MVEKEYIEREALIKRFERSPLFTNFGEDGCFILKGVIEIIKGQPTVQPAADVVEVRHEGWIKDERTSDVCAEYRCSLCGFMYCESDPKYPPYKYCPECGAKNE